MWFQCMWNHKTTEEHGLKAVLKLSIHIYDLYYDLYYILWFMNYIYDYLWLKTSLCHFLMVLLIYPPVVVRDRTQAEVK